MRKKRRSLLQSVLIMAAVFAVLFIAAVSLLNQIQTTSDAEQLHMVETAVHDALMTCYAAEGAYPAAIDYLEANYGLAYDKENVHVIYDAFASNVMPTIKAVKRGDGQP